MTRVLINKTGFKYPYAYNQLNRYPLQKKFALMGTLSGIFIGVLSMSGLDGLSFFILFLTLGIVWRYDEPPIIPFCIFYQWIFIVTGYFYNKVYGYYPGMEYIGNIEGAVFFSLIGFVFIALGIRTGIFLTSSIRLLKSSYKNLYINYKISTLFWLVIAVNFLDYFMQISPVLISFKASQIIKSVMLFRIVLFFLLLHETFRQRKGYKYGFIAFCFVILPQFTSMMSDFKTIIFLLIIAIGAQWRPWLKTLESRKRNLRLASACVLVAIVLAFMALFWEGGVKKIWRPAYKVGDIQGSPIEKLDLFGSVVVSASNDMDFSDNLESLSSRLSSGVGYFSLVLDRVPKILPHENGFMITRALNHITKPRFLFPSKKNLEGSDSWIVRKYAGIYVSGEESDTSVGLGYIAQFYIDFGIPGILIMCLVFGTVIGFLYTSMKLVAPSYNFYVSAVVVLLLEHFSGYESEIAKLLGGLIMNAIVFAIVLYFAGPILHRTLMVNNRTVH